VRPLPDLPPGHRGDAAAGEAIQAERVDLVDDHLGFLGSADASGDADAGLVGRGGAGRGLGDVSIAPPTAPSPN
jgi:hypothetical protein